MWATALWLLSNSVSGLDVKYVGMVCCVVREASVSCLWLDCFLWFCTSFRFPLCLLAGGTATVDDFFLFPWVNCTALFSTRSSEACVTLAGPPSEVECPLTEVWLAIRLEPRVCERLFDRWDIFGLRWVLPVWFTRSFAVAWAGLDLGLRRISWSLGADPHRFLSLEVISVELAAWILCVAIVEFAVVRLGLLVLQLAIGLTILSNDCCSCCWAEVASWKPHRLLETSSFHGSCRGYCCMRAVEFLDSFLFFTLAPLLCPKGCWDWCKLCSIDTAAMLRAFSCGVSVARIWKRLLFGTTTPLWWDGGPPNRAGFWSTAVTFLRPDDLLVLAGGLTTLVASFRAVFLHFFFGGCWLHFIPLPCGKVVDGAPVKLKHNKKSPIHYIHTTRWYDVSMLHACLLLYKPAFWLSEVTVLFWYSHFSNLSLLLRGRKLSASCWAPSSLFVFLVAPREHFTPWW